ncbi:hypothetical protein PSY31_23775, partial [Shigella flexneri]|nr:hypothetical protein [Shigella flexneri]
SMANIGVKFTGANYGLWSQVVENFLAGKDKLGYINGDISMPAETDPNFRKWRVENAVVKGWITNSLDPTLLGDFMRHPTA